MSLASTSHLLLLSVPAWGHTRPLCVLAARLVCERENIVVTFLSAPNVLSKVHSEIARQFQTGSSDKRLQRIRVVSTFKSNEVDFFKLYGPFIESYSATYQTLSDGKPITCATTGTTFDAVPAPDLAIIDFFFLPQLQVTRSISGRSVPVIAWATGNISTTIRFFGPESMGGLDDFGARIDAEAARSNKSVEEVGLSVFKHTDGTVINVPGVPPMYDYEYFPQKLPFSDAPVVAFIRSSRTFFMECDGVIVNTAEVYEKASLEAMKTWLSGQQKSLHILGPLLPDPFAHSSEIGDDNAEIKAFLETKLKENGERSVLFISFGTFFWPSTTEYMEEVIDALSEKNFPFILCHASPFASVSTELAAKVQSSGLGLLTKWAPQQFVLDHPATGWFLTHSGHGSVMETLRSGIPPICWPYDADQPNAAAHLSETLKVAFEPIEVKNNLGGRPLHRNGQAPQDTREAVGIEFRKIIDACRGQEGKELRRNVEQLKAELSKAWEEGGVAKTAMGAFLDEYHL